MIGDVHQREAVERWWAKADQTTRRRALRLRHHDLLPADMQIELAMEGVTITTVGVDCSGRPRGHWVPEVLWAFLRTRGRAGILFAPAD